MKRLKIDRSDLELAFETASDETEYYLDTETGEVILLMGDMGSEMREWREAIAEDEEERYAQIPALSTPEGYREMMLFVETVHSRELREQLKMATSGRGAFRRFKDVLVRYPEERQQWFAFRQERLQERIAEWLQELGIEIESPD